MILLAVWFFHLHLLAWLDARQGAANRLAAQVSVIPRLSCWPRSFSMLLDSDIAWVCLSVMLTHQNC